ncbi:MAG TPA: hypothetical protein VK977_09160 [Actinomycetota bacterium]|nr:hypothetical protein [Actinomycetota bacterium]
MAVARGQTARLMAVNLGSEPVQVTATLLGTAGRFGRRTFDLTPGASGKLDLSGPQRILPFDRRGRLELHAEFTLQQSGSVAGSLQIFDTRSGRTTVNLVATVPDPPPKPAQATAMMGVAAGQIARVSVVNVGPSPTTVVAAVIRGSQTVKSRDLELQPGQIQSIDVNPSAAGLPFDRTGRVEVRGVVTAPDDADVVASMEVFSVEGGFTTAHQNAVSPIQVPVAPVG